ncbi:MAG: STAS domain-containing protein [Chlorobiaceae bacterium]|jgi:anti-sigma B factor antagonist|nr:STAS domain-containing protein [Chlorobiaceae bacterium]
MIISEKIISNISILAPEGSLDAATVPQLQNFTAKSELTPTLVLNLSRVDFLDSSGLGAIVGMARNKRESGGDVVLACMNDRVRKVFEITRVARLFHIFDDLEAAAGYAEKHQKSL